LFEADRRSRYNPDADIQSAMPKRSVEFGKAIPRSLVTRKVSNRASNRKIAISSYDDVEHRQTGLPAGSRVLHLARGISFRGNTYRILAGGRFSRDDRADAMNALMIDQR